MSDLFKNGRFQYYRFLHASKGLPFGTKTACSYFGSSNNHSPKYTSTNVFSRRFFFETPEVTKVVLPKVLQNFKKTPNCTCWPQETNQKGFSFFPQNIQYRTRLKGPPFSFFGIARLFCEKNSQRVPLQLF